MYVVSGETTDVDGDDQIEPQASRRTGTGDKTNDDGVMKSSARTLQQHLIL